MGVSIGVFVLIGNGVAESSSVASGTRGGGCAVSPGGGVSVFVGSRGEIISMVGVAFSTPCAEGVSEGSDSSPVTGIRVPVPHPISMEMPTIKTNAFIRKLFFLIDLVFIFAPSS